MAKFDKLTDRQLMEALFRKVERLERHLFPDIKSERKRRVYEPGSAIVRLINHNKQKFGS